MMEDGFEDTHPIIEPVSIPDEINEIFDAISYEKVMYAHVCVCVCMCAWGDVS